MASWWRQFVESIATTEEIQNTSGPWKRKAAILLGVNPDGTGPWNRKIALELGVGRDGSGPWDRRTVPEGVDITRGPWARAVKLESGLVVQPPPNLLVNPGFDIDASWTKGTNITISGGKAIFATVGQATLTQSETLWTEELEAGVTYCAGFDALRTSGSYRVGFGTGTAVLSAAQAVSTKVYFEIVPNSGNTTFFVRAESGGFGGEGDNAYLFRKTSIALPLHFDGDSFMGGQGVVLLPMAVSGRMLRLSVNAGQGGSTIATQSARIIADTTNRADTLIWWDGDHNGLTTVASYCDSIQAALDTLGHSRFLLIPACVNYGQAAPHTTENAIRDEFLVRWPNNVIDWRDVLSLDGNGVPISTMYLDPGPDNTHLSVAAMELMAVAIKNFIESRGW